MNRPFFAFLSLAAAAIVPFAHAGEDLVVWPENYASHFVRYLSVDKPEGDSPAKIRFMYVNAESLTRSKAGKPLADDTILIMEDRKIALNADGKPLTDKHGRFIPTNEITAVIVQQKKAGWGSEYEEAVRNGEWEYAVFHADGTRKQGVEYEKCFICHKQQAAADYNFTFSPFLSRIKP